MLPWGHRNNPQFDPHGRRPHRIRTKQARNLKGLQCVSQVARVHTKAKLTTNCSPHDMIYCASIRFPSLWRSRCRDSLPGQRSSKRTKVKVWSWRGPKREPRAKRVGTFLGSKHWPRLGFPSRACQNGSWSPSWWTTATCPKRLRITTQRAGIVN